MIKIGSVGTSKTNINGQWHKKADIGTGQPGTMPPTNDVATPDMRLQQVLQSLQQATAIIQEMMTGNMSGDTYIPGQ